MESPEGRGIALSAWELLGGPPAVPELRPRTPINPLVKRLGTSAVIDLIGFWVMWHLRGGFEGLRGIGIPTDQPLTVLHLPRHAQVIALTVRRNASVDRCPNHSGSPNHSGNIHAQSDAPAFANVP